MPNDSPPGHSRSRQSAPPNDRGGRDRTTDSAALAGTALAGVLAVMMEKGPYDWLNLVVGLTLLLIIFGYERDHFRTTRQSVALAAVCALCSLLIFGVLIEFYLGGCSLKGQTSFEGFIAPGETISNLVSGENRASVEGAQLLRIETEDTKVSSEVLLGIWLFVFLICFGADMGNQRRLAERRSAAELHCP